MADGQALMWAAEGPAPSALEVRPLPARARQVLAALGASPRLVVHLRLVHDVACHLLERLERDWPALTVNAEVVRLGAALHDIGKTRHPEELVAPGSAHETVGAALLAMHGIPDRIARIANTHGSWDRPDATIEDLLVSLADRCGRAAGNRSSRTCSSMAWRRRLRRRAGRRSPGSTSSFRI
jgi:putative nucleotidyltransferase with HDIG domain